MVGKNLDKPDGDIIVSIFMLTYNQEEYIAQAIEGVIAQKTNFKYQLVIGEDFSSDGTREICLDFAEKNPNKIKLLLNKKNIGLIANYIQTYAHCKGKYIAICDGDDYWIDPLKLQKQVDFLEANPDYKIVYTHNKNLFPSGKENERLKNQQPISTSFKDLIFNNYIPSVTVLFKRESLTKNMKMWILKYPYGDWPTYLYVLRNGGKIRFLDDVTAVYRKDFGTSTALRKKRSKIGEINLAILKDIFEDPEFANRKELIKASILNYKTGLMASYNKDYQFFRSFSILCALIFGGRWNALKIYFYSLKSTILS
tara:strand:- start:1031 stop:1966 length:936 start_codon:yes stop_codon:yes gene_type:complete